jgi:predicted transcriptional regulator
VRNAVQRLVTEGLLAEESAGRYRITPMVEVVLSTEKLAELDQWLREQNEATA